MDVTIREADESDLQLVRKHTVETGWSILSENERRELKHSARWSNRLK
jgi:hypothetical protein